MVLAGAICFFLLPVSQFPEITPPQVVVSANYPGASAQVVADTVTTPLEEQINGVEGMTYMSSASSNDGSSTITVTFNVGYPIHIAAVDVQTAVAEQTVQVAAGKIGQSPAPPGTPFEMQVNAAGRLSDPTEFSNIIVRADPGGGGVVRLRDVARVELGALQYSSSAYFAQDPTIVLAIFQMPGSNALDLQQRVKDKMEELSRHFPQGIAYAMHYDTTRFVSAAMHDVLITLSQALILVVLVVFVFLQSWRTTIIPTIAIPVSLVATLAVMELFGFSLNMLSLLASVLPIGLGVAGAIVVVENVERQLEAGLPPLAAARKPLSALSR